LSSPVRKISGQRPCMLCTYSALIVTSLMLVAAHAQVQLQTPQFRNQLQPQCSLPFVQGAGSARRVRVAGAPQGRAMGASRGGLRLSARLCGGDC
jgi:hypothetical protein